MNVLQKTLQKARDALSGISAVLLYIFPQKLEQKASVEQQTILKKSDTDAVPWRSASIFRKLTRTHSLVLAAFVGVLAFGVFQTNLLSTIPKTSSASWGQPCDTTCPVGSVCYEVWNLTSNDTYWSGDIIRKESSDDGTTFVIDGSISDNDGNLSKRQMGSPSLPVASKYYRFSFDQLNSNYRVIDTPQTDPRITSLNLTCQKNDWYPNTTTYDYGARTIGKVSAAAGQKVYLYVEQIATPVPPASATSTTTRTATKSVTPSSTPIGGGPSFTPTVTSSITTTPDPLYSATPTNTSSATSTSSTSSTPSSTLSPSLTATGSSTETPSVSSTPTLSSTPSISPTSTVTFTPSMTFTSTATATPDCYIPNDVFEQDYFPNIPGIVSDQPVGKLVTITQNNLRNFSCVDSYQSGILYGADIIAFFNDTPNTWYDVETTINPGLSPYADTIISDGTVGTGVFYKSGAITPYTGALLGYRDDKPGNLGSKVQFFAAEKTTYYVMIWNYYNAKAITTVNDNATDYTVIVTKSGAPTNTPTVTASTTATSTMTFTASTTNTPTNTATFTPTNTPIVGDWGDLYYVEMATQSPAVTPAVHLYNSLNTVLYLGDEADYFESMPNMPPEGTGGDITDDGVTLNGQNPVNDAFFLYPNQPVQFAVKVKHDLQNASQPIVLLLWADWDGDGTYVNSGNSDGWDVAEKVYYQVVNNVANGQIVTISATVPSNTTIISGNQANRQRLLRARVVPGADMTKLTSPFGVAQNGEVEDYLLDISAGTPSPTATNTATNTPTNTATATMTPQPILFQVEKGSATPITSAFCANPGDNIRLIGNNFIDFTTIMSGTVYFQSPAGAPIPVVPNALDWFNNEVSNLVIPTVIAPDPLGTPAHLWVYRQPNNIRSVNTLDLYLCAPTMTPTMTGTVTASATATASASVTASPTATGNAMSINLTKTTLSGAPILPMDTVDFEVSLTNNTTGPVPMPIALKDYIHVRGFPNLRTTDFHIINARVVSPFCADADNDSSNGDNCLQYVNAHKIDPLLDPYFKVTSIPIFGGEMPVGSMLKFRFTIQLEGVDLGQYTNVIDMTPYVSGMSINGLSIAPAGQPQQLRGLGWQSMTEASPVTAVNALAWSDFDVTGATSTPTSTITRTATITPTGTVPTSTATSTVSTSVTATPTGSATATITSTASISPTITATFDFDEHRVTIRAIDDQGDPLEDVTVSFDAEDDITDADGDAIFTHVDNGSYDITLEYCNDVFTDSQRIRSTDPYELLFTYELSCADTYDVRVNVEDSDGNTVSSAYVELDGETKTTNSSGYVTFYDVKEGTYTATASKDGTEGTRSFTVNGNEEITITLGTVTVKDVIIYAIDGTTRIPIGDLPITIDSNTKYTLSSGTDIGEAYFYDISVGEHTAYYTYCGVSDQAYSFPINETDPSPVTITLSLDCSYEVTVYVQDQEGYPVENACVAMDISGSTIPCALQTDSNGTVTYTNVSVGRHTASATLDDQFGSRIFTVPDTLDPVITLYLNLPVTGGGLDFLLPMLLVSVQVGGAWLLLRKK